MNKNNASFPQPTFPASTPVRIKIVNMDFIPIGGHGQQYRRPFVTYMAQETEKNLKAASANIKQHYKNTEEPINARFTAPNLHNFAMPQTEGVPVEFPAADGKSWGSEVASFIIEAEIEVQPGMGPQTCYIAGYTDRPIPRNGDPFDPNIVLTINSIFEYRGIYHRTEKSFEKRQHLLNAAQVLFDLNYSHMGMENQLHCQRPYNVAATACRLGDSALMQLGTTVTDTRNILNAVPIFSAYTNNDPMLWTEALLTANIKALNVHFDMGKEKKPLDYEYRTNVARFAREGNIRNNHFIRALAGVKDGLPSAQFTLSELYLVDPDAASKIHVLLEQKPSDDVFYSSFEGQDPEAHAANYIANSVPAIMAKYGIRMLDFGAVNASGLNIVIQGVGGVDDFVEPAITEECLKEIQLRVLDAISFQGSLMYSLSGRFDLFGSSQFSLELNKQSTRHYASPTFANSLFSPIVATSQKTLEANAEAFDAVFQSIMASVKIDLEPENEEIEDHLLNGDALDAKYNPNGDGEHPTLTRQAWREAVEQQDTLLGYWAWVSHKLNEAEDDKTYFGPG